MANSSRYYTKILRRNYWLRSLDVLILVLLISLVLYRALHLDSNNLAWNLAFLCESSFCFLWFLVTNIKWNPVEYVTYPDRLQQRVDELPAVDMFVTTADAVLEPPIITVNTVLSLLAVDYPANKLACYVSDDGGSPVTYFSLKEASKFAKIWVPFCKKYKVQVRAPFRYFSNPPITPESSDSLQFSQDWQNIKVEYEKLSRRLEEAGRGCFGLEEDDDFAAFSSAEPRNHAAIVKVIWENKGGVGDEREMPHLVYIAREKRPERPHHYKAGSMNVLVRVSGVMTNAPYMLNVDCDMYGNNAEVVRQAMCLFLGTERERDCAFVQSPQLFYDIPENEILVLHQFIGYGIVGIQGPFYQGSGCFHKRRVIYGLSPDDIDDDGNLCFLSKGKLLAEDKLLREFGQAKELVNSAARALEGKSKDQIALTSSLEEAHIVATSDYECGTAWGKKIGWLYGSTTEDINTSISIHSRGWRTLYNSPEPPAFLGCIPPGGPTAIGQQKRWATGLLELLLSKHNPILATLHRKLEFRQGLAYLFILVWGLRSVPELCYSLLPAYCILSDHAFLPKGPVLCIPISLFVVYNLYTLWEFLKVGLSVQCWWSCQQFGRIKATCGWLFSIPDVILKLMGLSETVFVVTRKTLPYTEEEQEEEDASKFVFDESPYFLPGTTILLVNLLALASVLMRLRPSNSSGGVGWGLADIMCSLWVVMSYWPFLRGLFEKGKHGIPLSTICKATILASLFLLLSKGSANPSI